MPRRAKSCEGDRVKVNDRAPLDYAGREGTVFGRAPGKGGYDVRFDDGAGNLYGQFRTEGYLDSRWLDPEPPSRARQ